MRIITGLYKGRRLKTLEGHKVRPTSDRLRETLFNVLAPVIEGSRFLDLCAGSGAVGIEAMSRGAEKVVFIESSRKASSIISENLRHCGIDHGVRVINRDVLTALKYLAQSDSQFDIIYLDPPYDSEIYSAIMWQLARSNLPATGGLVVVEHRRRMPLAQGFDNLRPYREINQGESCLTFFSREIDHQMQ